VMMDVSCAHSTMSTARNTHVLTVSHVITVCRGIESLQKQLPLRIVNFHKFVIPFQDTRRITG
jgi:hypothetical protein